MTFGSLEVKKRVVAAVWLVLVNTILFDCCDFEIRQGAFGNKRCINVLDCSCFISSGVRE